MFLILKDLKSYLRSSILSFWLVQNLSSLTEGFSMSRRPDKAGMTTIETKFAAVGMFDY
jgi:hypothetical protein